MHSIETNTNTRLPLLAVALLCTSLTATATEIGISEPGTDEYPNGGMRLITELPFTIYGKSLVVDVEDQAVYHATVPGGNVPSEFRKLDLYTLEVQEAAPKPPRIVGPHHMVFRAGSDFALLFSNHRSEGSVVAREIDAAGGRTREFATIDFPGMVFGAEIPTADQIALVSDTSPIQVGLFDLDTFEEVDLIPFPEDSGDFLAASYNATQNLLFVLTHDVKTRITVVDINTSTIIDHADIEEGIANPAPVLIGNAAGDTLWIVDNTTGPDPAVIHRIDAAQLTVTESSTFTPGDNALITGFINADETLLVLQFFGRVVTVNSSTLEIVEGTPSFSISTLLPHDAHQKAVLTNYAPPPGTVSTLSLSPLQEIESAPMRPAGVSGNLWDPQHVFEDPMTSRTILLGDYRNMSFGDDPRAVIYGHDPFMLTSIMDIAEGGQYISRPVLPVLDIHRRRGIILESGSYRGTRLDQISVFDLDEMKSLMSHNDPTMDFRQVVVDPVDGSLIVLHAVGPILTRFHGETLEIEQQVPTLNEGEVLWRIALNDSTRTLYATNNSAQLLSFDADSLARLDTFDLPSTSSFVTLDESRSLAYVGTATSLPDAAIHEVDLVTGEIVRSLELPDGDRRPASMDLDPTTRQAWVATSQTQNRISRVDLETMTWLGSIRGTDTGYGAFTPDFEKGRVIYAAGYALRNPLFISLAQQGYIKATRLSLPSTADVESVNLYVHQPSGNIRAAIYADGTDKTLVWQSQEVPVSISDNFLTIPIASGAPTTLEIPAGDYWLAWQIDNMDPVMSYAGESPDNGFLFLQDFGDFPGTLDEDNVTSTGEQWVGTITADLAPIPGDINGDGAINVADVTLLANMLSGIIPTEPDPEVGDLNDDGFVNAQDLDILVEMIVAP